MPLKAAPMAVAKPKVSSSFNLTGKFFLDKLTKTSAFSTSQVSSLDKNSFYPFSLAPSPHKYIFLSAWAFGNSWHFIE